MIFSGRARLLSGDAPSTVISRTVVQRLIRFQLTRASRGPSAIAEHLVSMRVTKDNIYCALDRGLDPPSERKTSVGDGELDLENSELSLYASAVAELLFRCDQGADNASWVTNACVRLTSVHSR